MTTPEIFATLIGIGLLLTVLGQMFTLHRLKARK